MVSLAIVSAFPASATFSDGTAGLQGLLIVRKAGALQGSEPGSAELPSTL